MNKVVGPALLSLSLLAGAARAEEPVMTTLQINDLVLSGAEYWVHHEDRDPVYPDEILWGFYPVKGEPADDPQFDTASPAAIACSTKAWLKLKAFLEAPQPVLKRIVQIGQAQHYTPKFFLWTNDYSAANDPYPRALRANRLWFWKRNPQVPGSTPGYWKWESTVTQDGTCKVPEDAQIQQYLQQTLQALGG